MLLEWKSSIYRKKLFPVHSLLEPRMSGKAPIVSEKTQIMKHVGVQYISRRLGEWLENNSSSTACFWRLFCCTIHDTTLNTVYNSNYNK